MRDTYVVGMDRRDPTHPTYLGRPLASAHEPVFDQGLAFDVATLLERRQVLKAIGIAGIGAVVAACAPGATGSIITPSPVTTNSTSASATAASCLVIPEETAGPYPGDGSNGPDILTTSGVVRQDITASFGTSTTVAQGVPLTMRLELLDIADGCVPFAGAAVYAWHCDNAGGYSMYSRGLESENFLRGVQAAADDGVVTFTTVFPGCYPGRWPHVHFEVYPTLDLANDSANRIATSQIALPEDACAAVYATAGYESSARAFDGVSLRGDNVFGEDGGVSQLGTVEGSIDDALTVTLRVPVDLT